MQLFKLSLFISRGARASDAYTQPFLETLYKCFWVQMRFTSVSPLSLVRSLAQPIISWAPPKLLLNYFFWSRSILLKNLFHETFSLLLPSFTHSLLLSQDSFISIFHEYLLYTFTPSYLIYMLLWHFCNYFKLVQTASSLCFLLCTLRTLISIADAYCDIRVTTDRLYILIHSFSSKLSPRKMKAALLHLHTP